MGRSLDSSVSIVTKTGRARFRLPTASRDVYLRQNTSKVLWLSPRLLFGGDQRIFPGDKSVCVVTTHPYLVLKLGVSGTITTFPPTSLMAGSGTNVSLHFRSQI